MPSFSAVLVLALLLSSSAPGDSPQPLPPGGRSMLAQPDLAGLRFSAAAETATAEVVAVEGMPFDQAIRVAIQQQPREAWGVQLTAETNSPIRRGDVLLVSYFLKGLSSTDESGQVAVTAHVQQNRAPHTKLASLPGQTAEPWRHIVRSFVADRALGASENNFVFHLGYAPQTHGAFGKADTGSRMPPSIAATGRSSPRARRGTTWSSATGGPTCGGGPTRRAASPFAVSTASTRSPSAAAKRRLSRKPPTRPGGSAYASRSLRSWLNPSPSDYNS
jgi:hypothetical protein